MGLCLCWHGGTTADVGVATADDLSIASEDLGGAAADDPSVASKDVGVATEDLEHSCLLQSGYH